MSADLFMAATISPVPPHDVRTNSDVQNRTLTSGTLDDVALVVHHADGRVAVAIKCALDGFLVGARDANRSAMSSQLPAGVSDRLSGFDLDSDVVRLDVRSGTRVVFGVMLSRQPK